MRAKWLLRKQDWQCGCRCYIVSEVLVYFVNMLGNYGYHCCYLLLNLSVVVSELFGNIGNYYMFWCDHGKSIHTQIMMKI